MMGEEIERAEEAGRELGRDDRGLNESVLKNK